MYENEGFECCLVSLSSQGPSPHTILTLFPAPFHGGLLHAQTGDGGLPEEVQCQEETEGSLSLSLPSLGSLVLSFISFMCVYWTFSHAGHQGALGSGQQI